MAGEQVEFTTTSARAAALPLLSLAAPRPRVDARAQIRRSYTAGIRPDTQLLVSEWADAHRLLPKKSSAEPGPWRTDRTPYIREIMDNFSATSDVEETVLMKASQVAGTEAILNVLGYVVDHAPGPTMLVFPTVDLAKRASRQRLDPLFSDTPSLARKVAESRSRDSGNTMLSKDFPGGQLIVTGANSAVGLRSMPAQNVLMDEIDGYDSDVDGEGSPIELAEARQSTFARKKLLKVSTPTIEGRSAIAAAYADTDRRRYYVPCPHCGEMQPLEFSRLVWTARMLPPEEAVYECRACEQPIQNHHKTEMLREKGYGGLAEWRSDAVLELQVRRQVAEAEGRPDEVSAIDLEIQTIVKRSRKVRGYHLNALYAPVGWISWGDIAAKFLQVHKDPEKYQAFVNTKLGEVWRATAGEAPAWDPLWRRRETYKIGTVPMPALLLTAGVDVQKDRIIYEVVGWGRGKRSWSIDYGAFYGDTADLDNGPWKELDALLDTLYPHAGGVEMPIRMFAVDSGYSSQTVYNWGRKYSSSRVIAVDGRDRGVLLAGPPSMVDVDYRGRKLKRGYKIWPVAGPLVKSELYGWLRLEITPKHGEPPGYCHFPEYDEEYFKQLTAEQLVPHKKRGGYVRMVWERIPGRQNHVLDIRVYARAAAFVLGLDRFRDRNWEDYERMLGVPAPGVVTPSPAIDVAKPTSTNEPRVPAARPGAPGARPSVPPRRVSRSSYLGGGA